MKGTELLRLVWLNINQNKFKTIMTSIGIVVGAATIVMVIAIGRGGQMDVEEQFSSLNAGAIDVSYEWEAEEEASGGGFSLGGIGDFLMGGLGSMFSGFGGGPGGSSDGDSSSSGGGRGGMGGFGGMPGGGTDGESSGGGFTGSFPGGMGGDGSSLPENFPGQMGEDGEFSFPDGMGEDGEFSLPDGMGEDGEFSLPEEMEDGEIPEGSGEDGELPEEAGNAGEASGDGAGAAEGESGAASEEEAADAEAASEPDSAGEDADTDLEEADEDSAIAERMNQENVIFTMDDVEDIETFVPGLDGVTLSYSTRGSVEGGNLSEAQTYTVAGVKSNYVSVSNYSLAEGEFLTEEEDESKARVCVLGASVAREIYGSAAEAYGNMIYIDDRAYEIIGILNSSGTSSAGISPDEAVFVPYQTGIKYITGESISPVITVIAQDVNSIEEVEAMIEEVLEENYNNAEFSFSDAGSRMEAAESSNEILTMLLSAMAFIVFLVGGIGIMNVLFVSVKERTNEIGILKSLGASRKIILFEFLIESAAISLIGGVLGVGLSFAVAPIVEHYDVRVEANMTAWAAALGFAVLTGTLFGIYPAWKASRLVPVDALNAE